MKRLFLLLALLFSASLLAQAPEPMPLAHGNTPGEPHHHLKIENEYVRVYYVEVPPHENTQLHQHDHDYLFVTLGDSDVINAVRDKPEVHLILKDGETHFTHGGFAHVARNLSDKPFRNVTIELLHPQDDAHNLCQMIVPGELGPCSKKDVGTPGYIDEPLFETQEVRAELISLQPRAKFVQRVPFGCLYVALDSAELQDAPGKPALKLQPGDRFWVPAATILKLQNVAPSKARYLLLTIRRGALRTKTEGAS
jgi:quercetin dioxygenase-like cupin family protein